MPHHGARPACHPSSTLWVSAALAMVTHVRGRHPPAPSRCAFLFNHDAPPIVPHVGSSSKRVDRARQPGAMDRPRAPLGTHPFQAPCRVGQLLRLDHHTHRMPRAEIIIQYCAAILRIDPQRVCALSVSVAASRPLHSLFPVCSSRALTPWPPAPSTVLARSTTTRAETRQDGGHDAARRCH